MRHPILPALLMTALTSGCSLLFDTDGFLAKDAGGQNADASHPDAGSMDAGETDAGRDAGCVEMCSEVCTDTSHDPLHCGACGNACSAPENAQATCSDGTCGFTCSPGFDFVVGNCAARPAPRPIAPLSTATATSRRPTFRWELAPRNDGARIEICADRACTSVITTVDVTGDRGSPTVDLPPGVVFWRLYGRLADDVGLEPSPTWQVYIRARSAPVDTSWGTVPDVNGDGFADVIRRAAGGELHIHHGGPGALSPTPSTIITAPADAGGSFADSVESAGDVNGDGFADVIVGSPNSVSEIGHAYLFLGSASGLEAAPTSMIQDVLMEIPFRYQVLGIGDLNRDGYADIVTEWDDTIRVLSGSPSDLVGPLTFTLPSMSSTRPQMASCDVNGDSIPDLIVSERASPGSMFVYFGQTTGLFGSAPDQVIHGATGADPIYFGNAVSCGDANGDGFADVVVDGAAFAIAQGRVSIYHGSADGLDADQVALIEWGFSEGDTGDLASADFDGDGIDDLVVGRLATNAVHLYRGSVDGIDTEVPFSLPPPLGAAELGFRVRSTGDVNGDGFADLLASTFTEDYLFLGAASGFLTSPAITFPR